MPLFGNLTSINVLMCGGRRTGKTSIMAAMQSEALQKFSSGDIVLNIKGANLIAAQQSIKNSLLHDNLDSGLFFADDSATSSKEEFSCQVTLATNYRSPLHLNFIDVPGEWFVKPEFRDDVGSLFKSSQVIVIAVDSPHLVEEEGTYHECFNRPEKITDAIKQAFQGDLSKPRLVLFVPIKCELYRNNGEKQMRPNMPDLLAEIQKGYADLIQYLTVNLKDSCAVAVAPCITMGGLEFVTFVDNVDDDGNTPPEFVKDPETGLVNMTKLSEYVYLIRNGSRYFEPEDCVQPLLYILLFFVAVANKGKGGALVKFILKVLGLNNPKAMAQAKNSLTSKLKTDQKEGYAVLNDPFDMV